MRIQCNKNKWSNVCYHPACSYAGTTDYHGLETDFYFWREPRDDRDNVEEWRLCLRFSDEGSNYMSGNISLHIDDPIIMLVWSDFIAGLAREGKPSLWMTNNEDENCVDEPYTPVELIE
jgi:hypothetical protein